MVASDSSSRGCLARSADPGPASRQPKRASLYTALARRTPCPSSVCLDRLRCHGSLSAPPVVKALCLGARPRRAALFLQERVGSLHSQTFPRSLPQTFGHKDPPATRSP